VNRFIGTTELLARLDQLKNLVRDFAAREEQLTRRYREQCAKADALFEATANQFRAHVAEHLETAAEHFSQTRTELEHRCDRREDRINLVHSRLQKKIADAITAEEEECKRAGQQGLIAAERQRDEFLANAATAFQYFEHRLVEVTAAFLALEKSVRSAFSGSNKFRRQLDVETASLENPPAGDGNPLLDEVEKLSGKIEADLKRFKKFPLPQLFRFVPVWLLAVVLVGIALADPVLAHFGHPVITHWHAGLALAALVVVFAVHTFGLSPAAPLVATIATDFRRAKKWLAASHDLAATFYQNEQVRIENEFQTTKNAVNQEWRRLTREISQMRGVRPVEMESRIAALHKRNQHYEAALLAHIQQLHETELAALRAEAERRAEQHAASRQQAMAKLENEFKAELEILAGEWQTRVLPLFAALRAAQAAAENTFIPWSSPVWEGWQPPAEFLNAAKFGQLEIGLEQLTGGLPKDKRLALPGGKNISLPLLLTHPQNGSLLLETGKDGGGEAVGAINHLILQLLATTPPGRVEFTIFDPVGLGQNFAALMHLADYEASTINSRIWTQQAQFEEKLAELNEHMEKIIQMYLRNEYATITEYNAQAGSIAEKYHVLVIASFPANFSDVAAKRLRNIAANGARCGVFTLIQWDTRTPVPPEFVPDELRKNSVALVRTEKGFEFSGWRSAGTKIVLDAAPTPEVTTQLLHRIGSSGRNANRVEVPFEQVAPAPAEFWTEETAEELRVPIGRSSATKLQYLALGRDTRQHALLAGKTGSGKSTLFHIIVTNLALRCRPEQVEFYLVDFKKGVEFKCYANHRLPHAKVVAIESDRAFGLSVLQRVDEELRRRGDLFRKVGAQNLTGYKSSGSPEPMPRVLLLIDEFQEFFTEEDRVSQNAAVLLDRIVRQGRAFGIHVVLGSQTLGGAYTLARATIGQMVIRIALQCNEADALLIMDQDNSAPRLLSRPGEGIYNDTAGSIEGNSPFQAVWLSDQTRDHYLAQIRAQAGKSGKEYPGPIVFEGNAPADVRENQPLRAALKGGAPLPPRIWLGAPNSIKGPTEAVFRRQSAANLLVVGQSDERMLTILSLSLISLAAQFPKTGAQFFVLHNLAAGYPQTEFLQRVLAAMPQPVTQAGNGNLAEVMTTLAEELKRRQENENAGPEIFMLVHELQNFKKLRQEDEFSFSSGSSESLPAATLLSLINEGPARGIHVLLTCDSYGNLNRFLGRKTLGEIEMRVAFQMSAGDSASLIDAPDASTLGLHRAVLFNEREGRLETFRPYALPDNAWLDEIRKKLSEK
jgi:DNA segregation ATPase FtsK/SpoIIIE, S-DNA-T family